MNNPLVSVIVPAYNHELYIEDCLKSIVSQTYDNLEIIIINDGSKDNTGLVIEKFIEVQNRKIKYISKENEGLCKTLNMGLKLSKGKYIAFIASDDLWVSTRIEKQINFLENNKNIGLVYSDAYFIKDNKKTEIKYSDYKPRISRYFKDSIQNTNIYELLLVDNFIIALTVLVRRECYDKAGIFDESLKIEDYDMWLRITKYYPIGYIDVPLAYYRLHKTNVSNNMRLMLGEAIKTIFKQFKEEPLKSQPHKIPILFISFFLNALKYKLIKSINFQRRKSS